MVQTLGHMLMNWLLVTHGWLCLSSQALHKAHPICFLDTTAEVGMWFVTLLGFACVPIS